MIYFLQSSLDPNGPIKIGYSRAPKERLKALRAANSEQLKMILSIKGGMKDEYALHEKFAHLRHEGTEWFDPKPELLDFIKSQKFEDCEDPRENLSEELQEILGVLGENIKLCRLRRHISSGDLAKRAGITRITMGRIENGYAGSTIVNYLKVLKCLGLENDLLLLAKEDPAGRKIQDTDLLNKRK